MRPVAPSVDRSATAGRAPPWCSAWRHRATGLISAATIPAFSLPPTAINLALSLANEHKQTVLLVDCDLKRPSVASNLGIEPEHGLDDVLKGQARIEQCLYHPTGFDRLVILPARAPMGNSSECLSGPRGRDVAMELRHRYPDRIVIFDLPPVLNADDALAFLPFVECALVVVSEGATSRQDLLRCMELTRRTPIVGTVLNRASDVPSAYG